MKLKRFDNINEEKIKNFDDNFPSSEKVINGIKIIEYHALNTLNQSILETISKEDLEKRLDFIYKRILKLKKDYKEEKE